MGSSILFTVRVFQLSLAIMEVHSIFAIGPPRDASDAFISVSLKTVTVLSATLVRMSVPSVQFGRDRSYVFCVFFVFGEVQNGGTFLRCYMRAHQIHECLKMVSEYLVRLED